MISKEKGSTLIDHMRKLGSKIRETCETLLHYLLNSTPK
jgi:hypothetical protein